MSEKDFPSQAELPESAEPQKPILLVEAMESQHPIPLEGGVPQTSSNEVSLENEVPMANEEDIIELTEEVDETGKAEELPKEAPIGIVKVSHGEMSGQPEGMAQNSPSEIRPTVIAPMAAQNTANTILEMIEEETQPGHPAVAKRIPTPLGTPRIERSAHEILKEARGKLDKEIFKYGGKVKDESNIKIMDGDLLAIMEISRESKEVKSASDLFLQITSPGYTLPLAQPTETVGESNIEANQDSLAFAQNFRDGIYLILKSALTDEEALSQLEVMKFLNNGAAETPKAEKTVLSILGGRHAEKLKPEIVEEYFGKINNAADFFALTKRIEEAGDRKKAEAHPIESSEKTGTHQ